jgi:hypothetical protein
MSLIQNKQIQYPLSGSFSGSFSGTSSYASTSSYADNFTVAGTITAQKLVVQTISSSVVYSSGSNIFGNNPSNTQTFTGSIKITGSITSSNSMILTGSLELKPSASIDGFTIWGEPYTAGGQPFTGSYEAQLTFSPGYNPSPAAYNYPALTLSSPGSTALYYSTRMSISQGSGGVNMLSLTGPGNRNFSFYPYEQYFSSTFNLNLMPGAGYGVGINTLTPSASLHVKSTTNNGTVMTSFDNSTKKVIEIYDRGLIKAYAYNNTNVMYELGYAFQFDSGILKLNNQGGNGIYLAGAPDTSNYILNNLGINTLTPSASLHIKGTTSSALSSSLLVQNSNASASLIIYDDNRTELTQNTGYNSTITDGALVLRNPNNLSAALGVTSDGILRVKLLTGWGINFITDSDQTLIQGNRIYSFNTALRIGGNLSNSTSATNSSVLISDAITMVNSAHRYNALSITTPASSSITNGLVRGLFINPTFSGSVDYRAIETTAGNILFKTGSTTLMHISESGNVGIGTSTPGQYGISSGDALLSVSAPGTVRSAWLELVGTRNSAATSGVINFFNNMSGVKSTVPYASISGLAGATNDTAGTLRLLLADVEKVRLDSNGFGIGTSTPAARLDVASGSAIFRNDLNNSAYAKFVGVHDDGRQRLADSAGYNIIGWNPGSFGSVGCNTGYFNVGSLPGMMGWRVGDTLPIIAGAFIGIDSATGGTHKSLKIVTGETGGTSGYVDFETFSMIGNVGTGSRPSIRISTDKFIIGSDTSAGGTPSKATLAITGSAVSITGSLALTGSLSMSLATGTPVITATPAGYYQATLNGNTVYIPYYT